MRFNLRDVSRDVWLGLFFLGLLFVLTYFSVRQELQQTQDAIPYLQTSYGPIGTRALSLWLETQDYQLEEGIKQRFTVSNQTDIILMLEPTLSATEQEWGQLNSWVEQGGTLIVAGEGFVSLLAFEQYDIQLETQAQLLTDFSQTSPLIVSDQSPISANVNSYLQTDRADWVVHVASGDKPIVASFAQGRGRVFVMSTAYPFSNSGLKEAGNALFVASVLQTANGKQVWFDDWHHGIRSSSAYANGPGVWLRETAVGQSFLFIAILIFIWLLLQGRAFGRPVPLPAEVNKRTPLEYITAIANVNRRAGNQTTVLQDTHQRLKRHLGLRYRLSPALPDEEFIKQLKTYRLNLDTDEIEVLLQNLKKKPTNEAQLVQLVAQAYKWMDKG